VVLFGEFSLFSLKLVIFELKLNLAWGVPKPFLEFLEPIRIEDADKGINILRKISPLVFSNF